MRWSTIVHVVLAGLVALPLAAAAADCGAPGKAKIFDRANTTGKARLIYRSGKVPCVDKGGPGTTAHLSGSFDILYIDSVGSARGAFVMPSPWFLHKDTKAKYLNRDAPLGAGGVKIAGVRQAQNVRLSARSLGDSQQINIVSGPPGPSGVLAITTVNNAADGTSTRICTRWSLADGSVLNWQPEVPGVSAKLFLVGGVASTCDVVPLPTTTSTSTSTTTSTSVPTTTSTSVPTTTSTSTTTTTILVAEFITGPTAGTCGVSKTGGAGGTVIKSLACGGLNIGGGGATVPEGPTPAGAPTRFNASCGGGICSLTARTAAQDGNNNGCTNTGCNFGTFLSIANGGLSTCVHNTFRIPGSAALDTTTGDFSGSVPLSSAVNVTGNNANPCPSCVGGFCDGTAANAGAICTAVNVGGDTYDCLPGGVALVPFDVDLIPLSTDTETKTGPTFCPGQDASAPGLNGCFGSPACDYIEEVGSPAAGITIGGGTVPATLVSVFCIPATGNGLIDGAADLPGPGATALPGTLELKFQ